MNATEKNEDATPAPAPAPDEPNWSHSGFGASSALEALKRVARTRPASNHIEHADEGHGPTATELRKPTGQMRARPRRR